MKNFLRAGAVVVMVSFAGASALAQDAAKRSEEVAKGMVKFQDQLGAVKGQVDTILKSLEALTSAPAADVAKAYESFTKAVKDARKLGDEARSRAAKSKSARDKFVEEWAKDQKKIMNEDLRKAAEARQAQLSPLVESLNAAIDATSKAAAPFMQNLNDLVLFLGNDLSTTAIGAAGPAIGKSNADAVRLRAELDAASRAAGALAAFFKPSGAAGK